MICLVDRVEEVENNDSGLDVSTVLDEARSTWGRFRVPSTDRDAIVYCLDPARHELCARYKVSLRV